MVLMAQGFARWMKGDLDGARPLWVASLEIAREVGDHVEAATKTLAIASIDFRQGKRRGPLRAAIKALDELVALKNVTHAVMALDWVAALAVSRQPEQSLRLAAAVSRLRADLGGGMHPEASGLEAARTVAERLLDRPLFDRSWTEGHEMGFDEAVQCAHQLVASVMSERVPV